MMLHNLSFLAMPCIVVNNKDELYLRRAPYKLLFGSAKCGRWRNAVCLLRRPHLLRRMC